MIRYINTDLTIHGHDLQVLAQAFEDAEIHPLGVIPSGSGLHYMSFETAHQYDAPEPNIASFLSVIERLDEVALKVWDACELREFDIGYDCGAEPWAFNQTLSTNLLGRIVAVHMSLRIKLYPPEYPKSR